MSRYPPSDYRPRDRSRSPPRFPDRRPSAASIYDGRPPGPARNASDAPRGPRSQFDARPPLSSGLSAGSTSRPGYSSLRDAPPLSNADRGRPYREREYDRRERIGSPRERSPLGRNPKEPRDYAPRDLDIGRARRDSRDGPASAGSNYSDGQQLSSAPFRGGFSRGRGRGDSSFRGSRGGRSTYDDRDLFRRERSPSKGWGRDLSRDSREPERRDERRFERREDDRRPSDWTDREREREADRTRRDQPRLEARPSNESIGSANAAYSSSQAPPINPARLALIESAGGDTSVRRASVQHDLSAPRRDQPETPSYLNGRAETTANRYGSKESSPPTQAPPVPAFTLSLPTSTPTVQPAPSVQVSKANIDAKPTLSSSKFSDQNEERPGEDQKPGPPPDAPTAPKVPPPAPRAQLASPPPAAPRGPRAHETEDVPTPNNRLQGVKSMEKLPGPYAPSTVPVPPRQEGFGRPSLSPAGAPALPTLIQPVSPSASQTSRLSDLGAPTGPRATRMSPAHPSVSPRPPFASPRSDVGGGVGQPRMQTPPPSAPTGPRNRSYSVSPKAAPPTAPKGNTRAPPLAPRGPERGAMQPGRVPDRLGALPPWAPPSAPRGLQWNQWKRPGVPGFGDQAVPAKRDISGEEKAKAQETSSHIHISNDQASTAKPEDTSSKPPMQMTREMEVDKPPPRRQTSLMSGHSAARAFIGKPIESVEDDNEDTGMSDTGQELPSSSEEDDSELEPEENLTLFHAKFERQKRQLEAQMADLSKSPYRSTTPLESIARLSRISEKDLQEMNEKRDREMDVDDSPVRNNRQLLAASGRSSDSIEGPDLLTPKGDNDHRVAIRASDDSSEGIPRVRRPSPEPVSLPYLLKGAQPLFQDNQDFQDAFKRHEESEADILDVIEAEVATERGDQDHMEQSFVNEYQRWREECDELDRIKEEQEELERQQSIEPGPEPDVPALAPMNPYEGRRLHKFSSEYEIEQVLKQSEETARIEQERQDRETKKNQADMEKEARLPDQLTENNMRCGIFIDSNRYREPESLTLVFSYRPRADDFTENEQQIFIAAFKETPKKWGEIASLLPGRTYEDCIRHYYANKWDGRFRDNRTKKLKAGGRRGRGGARGPRGRMGGLMADLARADDFLSVENMSEKGRPRRAAAPTTFAEKEAEAKANLQGPSPAKKPGLTPKGDSNGETGPEKPGKRQKRTGEKPGRKPKATAQQLATLAPQASPGKQFLPGVQSKDDATRVSSLEDANLLAGLQGGHRALHNAEGQMVYMQEGFVQQMGAPEEADRSRPAAHGPPVKQSASSYWSVPEQNDFVKYIGHFGRDFAAIATHMGTKTQTMIKNHYMRQVEGGNRPELERAAIEAEERKARGEDLGPPPTPTPITKRKYDNPQPALQRPLAPHAEAMDIDDSGPAPRAALAKHASPPQYQPQPRGTTATQATPIPATRFAPSPLKTTAAPAPSHLAAGAHTRPLPPSVGNRLAFLSDTRTEHRPAAQPVPGFRTAQETTSRAPPAQPSRPPDDQYLRGLVEQQERAMRIQQYTGQTERVEQQPRHNIFPRNTPQGSPLPQPLHNPPDRKPVVEERAPSPPRAPFAPSGFSRTPLGSSALGPIGSTPFSSLSSRMPFSHSSPKREEPRPVPPPPAHTPPTSATPSEPKRSNVMSLLNDDEEPKPPKRESLPSMQQKVSSPTPQTFPPTTSGAHSSSMPSIRREPSFGQPSMPQSQFGRVSYGQQSSTPAPPPTSLTHEPSPGAGSASHTPKPDWAASVLGQSHQQSRTTPTLERDVRPYFSHNHRSSLLGQLNQPRANPSPPPLGSNTHSRTPSLTAQTAHQARDQPRSGLLGQQQTSSHQPAQPLQPNPYGSQPPSSYSQPPSSQSQNQAPHSHNNSINAPGPFPSFHHRTVSREDHIRQEQSLRVQRERDEQEARHRQREALDDRRREDERYLAQQRQQEQERQSLSRPQPLQPPPFGGAPFVTNRSLDLRGQSRMETEMAMREEEQQRQRQESEMRQREALNIREREVEEQRRRQQEDAYYRRTPLGGGFGVPPPSRR